MFDKYKPLGLKGASQKAAVALMAAMAFKPEQFACGNTKLFLKVTKESVFLLFLLFNVSSAERSVWSDGEAADCGTAEMGCQDPGFRQVRHAEEKDLFFLSTKRKNDCVAGSVSEDAACGGVDRQECANRAKQCSTQTLCGKHLERCGVCLL